MITNSAIFKFWFRFFGVQFLYLLAIIPSIVLFPVSYFFRYVIKRDWFWLLLNSTEDGDFGADWWLNREKLNKSFWSAWRWTIRNPAWNFHELIKPEWNGTYTDVRTINNTIGGKNPLVWASHYAGVYGLNHVYYRVNGKVYGRFGYAKKGTTIQAGTTGNRYNLKFRI
jgi:hypothetical protein